MKLLPLLLTGIAILGLTISGYLSASHWGDQPIACVGGGDCEYVNSSEYATLAGVPVSALGMLLYAALVTSALAWYLRPESERLPVLYWGIALSGFGYAAYLTYVELYVLEAVCFWCMTSAAILTISVVVSSAALLRGPQT